MTKDEFRHRTKAFASAVIVLVQATEPSTVTSHILRQLLRSGTSVGANYRAACRARSDSEMHAKLCIVEEEADETAFWLELLIEHNLAPRSKVSALLTEADEIIRMVVASKKRLAARIHALRTRESITSYLSELDAATELQTSTIDNQQSTILL